MAGVLAASDLIAAVCKTMGDEWATALGRITFLACFALHLSRASNTSISELHTRSSLRRRSSSVGASMSPHEVLLR